MWSVNLVIAVMGTDFLGFLIQQSAMKKAQVLNGSKNAKLDKVKEPKHEVRTLSPLFHKVR